jgi:hypothetical protein
MVADNVQGLNSERLGVSLVQLRRYFLLDEIVQHLSGCLGA